MKDHVGTKWPSTGRITPLFSDEKKADDSSLCRN